MPLQATSGAASYDAFGGGVPAVPQYIEDVFSCFLYSGTGASLTVSNGIDLSGKGGLTWIKNRSFGYDHSLFDTARGANQFISSNLTQAQASAGNMLNSFNNNGFTLGTDGYTGGAVNVSGSNYVSWTFRKQPKFFDVVTYTGNGTAGRTVAHNLGSTPACIIVKRTDDVGNWLTYHTSLGATKYLSLNTTEAQNTSITAWNNTAPTGTVFTVGSNATVNASGGTYVAYLFAHNAGGFGLTGTDNVISCGSWTENGSSQINVNLGFEPQWLMIKRTDSTSNWDIIDTMRGCAVTDGSYLRANTTGAEASWGAPYIAPTATGFASNFYTVSQLGTFIYIAIRRGPMKVPTSGTSVFSPVAQTGGGTVTTNFPVDLSLLTYRNFAYNKLAMDRLRGGTTNSFNYLTIDSTSVEDVGTGFGIGFDNNNAIVDTGFLTSSSFNGIYWNFRRAPSFFDEVCYTGNNTAGTTISHNLGVAPELLMLKSRNEAQSWNVFSSFGSTSCLFTNLDTTNAATTSTYGSGSGFEPLSAAPTASVLNISSANQLNKTGRTYVGYLFATCAGVSKVGSYTGTGTTKQVDCGFTAGARFVLIKRADASGAWYVWDTARGIVSGNDPYLLLNGTATEVTNTDYIDTYSAGFEISSTAPAAINASGGTFIFLAIA